MTTLSHNDVNAIPLRAVPFDAVQASRICSTKSCTELMQGTLEEIRTFAERMNLGRSDEDLYNESVKDLR